MAPEVEAGILRDYDPQGFGTTLVGRKYDVDKATVRAILRRNGRATPVLKGFRLPSRGDAFDVLTPEASYWAGMLMADGCVSISRNPKQNWDLAPQLILVLHRDDEHHIRRFQEFIGAQKHKVSQGENAQNWEIRGWGSSLWSRLAVASRPICTRLIALGVTQAKTFTATASPEISMNRDFWRGLIDGDGTVARGQAYLNILGSVHICNQFMLYLDTTFPGISYHLAERQGCWQVGLSGDGARAAMGHFYRPGDICLLRKMYRVRHWVSGSFQKLPVYG